MSMTDVDYKGDLELHLKYGGTWMMKAILKDVNSKDLIQAIEELSLRLQRTIDKVSRGETTEKNVIPMKNYPDEEGVKD